MRANCIKALRNALNFWDEFGHCPGFECREEIEEQLETQLEKNRI
jgi:hypothetical protein